MICQSTDNSNSVFHASRLSFLIVALWIGVMAVVVHRSYIHASGSLATDLARYGSSAQWRGVYYRGEKVGFTVSQTVPVASGEGEAAGDLELQEDGSAADVVARRAHSHEDSHDGARQSIVRAAVVRVRARSGTGPITIIGESYDGGARLSAHYGFAVSITTGGRTRSEVLRLPERPMLGLNLVRRLAERD